MPPPPLAQIRVIAAAEHAAAILARLTTAARITLGPHITCRTTTRPARRAGHVRAYLTVTRREPHDHHEH